MIKQNTQKLHQIVSPVEAQGFTTVTVSTNPKTVSSAATLTFALQTTTGTGNLATGNTLTFIMTGGQFTPSTQTSLCTSLTTGITVTACSITTNQVVVTISTTVNTRNFQVAVQNFKNHYSTTPLTGIKAYLKTSAGITRATFLTATLSNLIADQMKSAQLTPLSNLIGESGVSLQIDITIKNALPSTGQLEIYFPKWNPSDGDLAYDQIQNSGPACTNLLNMNPFMGCSYDYSSQNLTVINPILSDVEGDTQLSFIVDSFLNPYSGIPRSGFTIVTTDSAGGFIDSTVIAGITISIQVTDWASFGSLSLQRVDTMQTVGELSVGTIQFFLDLPIDANCRLQVTFPSDMPLTTDLTQLTSDGMITQTLVSPTYFNESANTFYLDGCTEYQSNIQNILTMYKMKNKAYVMQTFSFSVYLWAIDSSSIAYPIAKQESGIIFEASDFVQGTITNFVLTPIESTEVQNHTRYTLNIYPVHTIQQSSMITVQFPTPINLTEGSCTVQLPVSPMSSDALCSVASNILTVTYPFGASGSFAQSSAGLQFTFSSGGENPLSEKDVGTFYVNTYAIDTGQPYHIDTNSFNNVFTPVRGTIGMIVYNITSYQTYQAPTSYTFQVTPTKKIPQNSILTIEIPPVVTLVGSNVPSCTYIINGDNYYSTSMQTLQKSERPYLQDTQQRQSLGTLLTPQTVIQINDAFSNMWYLDPGTPFYIICDGFRNPRTTRTTATFKIYTQDQNGYYLEQLLTGITTQMLTRPDMPDFNVSISNYTNGAINTYNFTTYSPLPHFTGDIIVFSFPLEIILPNPVVCTPLGALTEISCTAIDALTVAGTMSFENNFNEVGVLINFLVLNVQNPPDTRLSSPFQNVIITDPLSYQLTQYIKETTVQTLYFATIQQKILIQTDYGLLKSAEYSFTYTAINRMPVGSAFLIEYPPTVSPPPVLSTCNILYGGITYNLYGCAVDLDNAIITVAGGFNTFVTAGSQIVITLGPIITPISQLNPGEFVLAAYVSSQFRFFIDQIPRGQGLVPIFECDHPCRTCELPSRTTCLSCKTNVPTEILIYLQAGKCIPICPDGRFGNIKNDKICEDCPDECLTCFNELTCTRCKGNYPLTELYQGWCYPSCPPGLCPINFKCSPCNAPPFAQISVTANPSTVGKVSQVQLTATLGVTSSAYYGNNDILWLLIPEPGVFIISNDTNQLWRQQRYQDYYSDINLCQSLTLGITVDYCTIYLSRVMLKLNTTIQTLKSAQFLVGNFQNPSTTTPIPGIQTLLTTGTDTPKAVYQNTFMINLTPQRILSAAISPSSQTIGANGLTLTVSFTNMNTFATDNQIWVLLPYWNPRSATPKHMIQTATPNCIGLTAVKTQLTCVYDSLSRLLKITNAVQSALPINSSISFTVSDFQNPYNGIEKSGFQIQTMEATGRGQIDQSDILSITVSQFAKLNSPSLFRADTITTVGELSSLTFGFSLDLPVDPDCRVRILFPSDQPLTPDLKSSSGTNLFISASGLSTIDFVHNYAEVAGCPNYKERTVANQQSTVTLAQILNIGWVKDTLPFSFELYAMYNGTHYKIADISDPTTIVKASTMLTRGQITTLGVNATNPRAGQFSEYKITVQPIHAIPSQNKVKVKFPTSGNTIQLIETACSISQTSGGVDSNQATCYVDITTNEIVLVNAFGASGSFPKDGSEFSFLFSSGGTNPVKTCGTIQFQVSTFASIGDVDYAIDFQSFDSLVDIPPRFTTFIPQAPILSASIQSLSSYIASYKPTTYIFTITPNINVPVGSLLIMNMPPTVILPLGVTQINCTATIGTDIYYEFAIPTSLTPLKFLLKNLFALKAYTNVGNPFTLKCDGIWNPRTLEPTASFIIQTADQESCSIESVSSGLTVSMTSLPSFHRVVVTNDNLFNGQYSTLIFEVMPSVLFYNNDVLYLTFPSELTLSSTPICQKGNLLKTINCTSPSQNVLKVAFTFKTPQLADSYIITFKVFQVRNPSNTKQTLPFTNILAQDFNGNKIAIYGSVGPTIKNLYPSLAVGTLVQNNTLLGAATQYTISYQTINSMPSGSSFLIEYPETVTLPQYLTQCSITYQNTQYPMRCPIDNQLRQIKVLDGLTIPIPEGSQLAISLSPITNPSTPLSVSSFKLTSFTDFNQIYLIDKIPNNLVPQYQCAYPCATCPSFANRTICLSCFTTEVEKYLYQSKCVAVCPFPSQPDEFYHCSGPKIDFTTKLLGISNYQASYEPTQYAIQILPQKAIPDGSKIQITFPIDITLASGAINIVCQTYAQRSLSQAFNNTGRVTMLSGVPPLIIQIEGIFESKATFDIGSAITITCDQLKNPPTLTSSGSFSVSISNPMAPTLVVSSGMSVTMNQLSSNIQFKIWPMNLVTGQISDYKVTIQSGQALYSGSSLQLPLPSVLKLPEAVSCSLLSTTLQSIACSQDITCATPSGASMTTYIRVPNGLVKALFTFTTDPLPANTQFSFIISNIGNPPNSRPVSITSVSLYDQNSILIPEPSSTIPPFGMQIIPEVEQKSISFDSLAFGAKTGVTIQYINLNKMDPQSYIIVGYPISATFSQGIEIACAVAVNQVAFAQICKIDRVKREITIQLFSAIGQLTSQAYIQSGSQIQITIKDFINNAQNLGASTDTFTVKSFVDKQRAFGIEKISNGLILYTCNDGFFQDGALCNYCNPPCQTCHGTGDQCLSCSTDPYNLAQYLYKGACYQVIQCPPN